MRSFLLFALQVDNMELPIIEGVAAHDGTLPAMQSALRECHGLQCGFCTPGFVISLTALLRDSYERDDDLQQRTGLSGNFRQCTG